MGQHCPHTGCSGLEARETKQRIEPYHSPGRPAKALHFAGEVRAFAAVESIAYEEDGRTLPEDAAAPATVEVEQAVSDASSSGPVADHAAHLDECIVDVAAPQCARDVGQPGTEREGVKAAALRPDGMQEVQQHAGVPIHGAGNVAQDDEWHRSSMTPSSTQREPFAAGAQRPTYRCPHVDRSASGMGASASGDDIGQIEAKFSQHALGFCHLFESHRLEVTLHEDLASRDAQGGIEFDRFVFVLMRIPWGRGSKGCTQPVVERPIVIPRRQFSGCLRQHQLQCAFHQFRIAPEYLERLVKEHTLLGAIDERGLERDPEIVPASDVDERQGFDGRHDLARPDGQARAPQDAPERGHVFGQVTGAFPDHASIPARDCVSSRAASGPRTRAMSSWYFRRAPRVSSTICGSSTT
jgi:hypothetical protein